MTTKRILMGLAVVFAAIVVACSSEDATGDALGGGSSSSGGACPTENPNCREAATVEQGALSVKSKRCVECHTESMAGSTTALAVQNAGPDVKLYPPNLTNDKETGIGSWTDEQLALAIRNGIDDQSLELCPQMKHFSTMSDFEVFSIIKYLRSIPAVKQAVPRSTCPPLK